MVQQFIIGQFLPPYVAAVMRRARVRSNAVTIQQGIRAGQTNAQIQDTIRARQGTGLRNQDLGRAVNYLRDEMNRQQNYRNLPLNARPRVDGIPVFWGRMDDNFKSVVEMDVVNNKTGVSSRKAITVWYGDNLSADEIRELGQSEMQRYLEEQPDNDQYDVTIVNTLQTAIYRRPILN